MPVILPLGEWKQDGQELNARLAYKASLEVSWISRDSGISPPPTRVNVGTKLLEPGPLLGIPTQGIANQNHSKRQPPIYQDGRYQKRQRVAKFAEDTEKATFYRVGGSNSAYQL